MNADFDLSAYWYDLPERLVAKEPKVPRDQAKLLVVDRKTGHFEDYKVCDLVHILEQGDRLICNDTQVVPLRLLGKRAGGGEAEFLLVKPDAEPGVWEAMARPGKKLRPGTFIPIAQSFYIEVLQDLPNGLKQVRLHYEGELDSVLEKFGHLPVPHYIRGNEIRKSDERDYQTIFARAKGAAAAPTAGLHFTDTLMARLKEQGVGLTTVTLHVGPGTFRPVQSEDIRQHRMHEERYLLSEEAAATLNAKESGRRICVGTTCCRVLETAADATGRLHAGMGCTDIFIYPGYVFKYVDHLMTNFHWPMSSLLMLVSAFAGRELILEAYRYAISQEYRFYSYGDAMLIL